MRNENEVGEKIRHLREDRNVSREELAQKASCTVELIEKLENGAPVPSLAPLLGIARALGVRLGTFMDDAPQTGPFVVKNGKSENVTHFSGNKAVNGNALDFYSLAYGKSDRHMEPFIIDVHPLEGDYKLKPHEGEEFIYVMNGQIEIMYGQENYILSEGDSIYYDSVVPHDLHAYMEDAKILAVVYTPI
jgi:transcriptional regulator with XRE-family HTH domain